MKNYIRPRVKWRVDGNTYPIIQATENYYLVESSDGKRFSIHEKDGEIVHPIDPENTGKLKKG